MKRFVLAVALGLILPLAFAEEPTAESSGSSGTGSTQTAETASSDSTQSTSSDQSATVSDGSTQTADSQTAAADSTADSTAGGTEAAPAGTAAEGSTQSSSTQSAEAPASSSQSSSTETSGTAAKAPAQTAGPAPEPAKFGFKAGITLGTDVLTTGTGGAAESWTKLGFQPDISFGKVGIGLDLTVHFKLYPSNTQAIEFYGGDWIPNYNGNGKTFLDVYLPKFLYIRYGERNRDPLYLKFGSIDDLTLGDGFIMNEYSNMKFMPETRIFGMDVGVDGSLFDFPYAGFELLTGNLACFDVIGGRVFARPLLMLSTPIVKNLQVGVSAVFDKDPYKYSTGGTGTAGTVGVYGVDAMLPILTGKIFPLAAYADLAWEPLSSTMGSALGVGGRAFSFLSYGAQIRVLEDGFIPSYFDANYDLYRAVKYDYSSAYTTSGTFAPAWYASLGFNLLGDRIVLKAGLDGPFAAIPATASNSQADYPHAKVVAKIGEGLLGGFYADASYEKYYIGRQASFFSDLVDPTDAVIGAGINYKTGLAVITLNYYAKWDTSTQEFVVTSSLSTSVKF